jgi:hypothetical protein
MSKNPATIPDAWDADWEQITDVRLDSCTHDRPVCYSQCIILEGTCKA